MVRRVKWSVYLKYIENIGAVVAFFCLVMYFIGQGLQIGANAWLSVWADANERDNGSSTVEKVFTIRSYRRILDLFSPTITVSRQGVLPTRTCSKMHIGPVFETSSLSFPPSPDMPFAANSGRQYLLPACD